MCPWLVSKWKRSHVRDNVYILSVNVPIFNKNLSSKTRNYITHSCTSRLLCENTCPRSNCILLHLGQSRGCRPRLLSCMSPQLFCKLWRLHRNLPQRVFHIHKIYCSRLEYMMFGGGNHCHHYSFLKMNDNVVKMQ